MNNSGGEYPTLAAQQYISGWSSVLRSTKTSTLKLAVCRAILDEVRQSQTVDDLRVGRKQLAARLVSYYWYQVRQFRLKQAAAEIQEPNVVRCLRAISEPVGTKWNPDHPEICAAVEYVSEQGFREVIPRFHNGLPHKLFEPASARAICVPAAQRRFIQDFWPLLMRSVLSAWAAQVETYNVSPRIFGKVRFDGSRRTSVGRWARPLREFENACFYCREAAPEKAHVDHVIPWSFLFDDPAWDLVLACERCNLSKRDSLPDTVFLQRLSDRNNELRTTCAFGKQVAFSLTQLPLSSEHGFTKALELFCEQAAMQGFSADWQP